jgi:hypothetical protein
VAKVISQSEKYFSKPGKNIFLIMRFKEEPPEDIVGNIYRSFDAYAASSIIPPQIEK